MEMRFLKAPQVTWWDICIDSEVKWTLEGLYPVYWPHLHLNLAAAELSALDEITVQYKFSKKSSASLKLESSNSADWVITGKMQSMPLGMVTTFSYRWGNVMPPNVDQYILGEK